MELTSPERHLFGLTQRFDKISGESFRGGDVIWDFLQSRCNQDENDKLNDCFAPAYRVGTTEIVPYRGGTLENPRSMDDKTITTKKSDV